METACTQVKTLRFRTRGWTPSPAFLLEAQVFDRQWRWHFRQWGTWTLGSRVTSYNRTTKGSYQFYTQEEGLVLDPHLGTVQKQKSSLKVYVEDYLFQLVSKRRTEYLLIIKGQGEQILIYPTDGQTAKQYNDQLGCILAWSLHGIL